MVTCKAHPLYHDPTPKLISIVARINASLLLRNGRSSGAMYESTTRTDLVLLTHGDPYSLSIIQLGPPTPSGLQYTSGDSRHCLLPLGIYWGFHTPNLTPTLDLLRQQACFWYITCFSNISAFPSRQCPPAPEALVVANKKYG